MRRPLLALLCACLWSGLAAAQDAADWDKVVQAAKKEGHVVVYNSAIGSPFYKAAVGSFEKKYGIQVDTLDIRANEMRERIRTEQAAGRFLGDVTQPGQATATNQQERDNAFQPHGPIPNIENLRQPFAATDIQVPAFVQAYGILANTNLVKPADEPKSWTDLLDAKWRGKILFDDPRAIGGGQVMFFATYDALGREFHDKFSQQGLTLSRDLRNDERRVARGEFAMYVPEVLAFALDLKGLPVKLLIMSEGVPYVTIVSVMLRNAPHPNAARLLINHILEPEVQLFYANGGQVPVTDVLAQVDADKRPLAGAKLMGTTNAPRQDAMLSLAKDIYK
ncbi:MAG: extracellular solute-binding protein [Alphaproteobacteria bacterium]|nr:extracellular solute-binding protein [Alphaproteobacteria bacterium]